MKFLDQAKIYIRSGNGGAGSVSFRREKFIEFGGPDGGNGGRGGDIWMKAVDGLNTLIDFRYRQHFFAGKGKSGMGSNQTGAGGDDITIPVPLGTQVYQEDNQTLICDLTYVGESFRLARGGNGGFGNQHFKTSTNRAPRHANPGQDGEELCLWIRLKLIADVGLIGLPNAGKSTFLSTVTSAKPKIGDYPFTTLYPALGVVRTPFSEFVLADMPGLISGASQGKGLGIRFLGHVERTHVLIHLVSALHENPGEAYQTVRKELFSYGCGLADKPEIVALSCVDLLNDSIIRKKKQDDLEKVIGYAPIMVSAFSGEGISCMKETVSTLLKNLSLSKIVS